MVRWDLLKPGQMGRAGEREERGCEQDGSQSEPKAKASLRGLSCPRLVWGRVGVSGWTFSARKVTQ